MKGTYSSDHQFSGDMLVSRRVTKKSQVFPQGHPPKVSSFETKKTQRKELESQMVSEAKILCASEIYHTNSREKITTRWAPTSYKWPYK